MDLATLKSVKQLAQSHAPNTSAYSLISNTRRSQYIITSMIIANSTTSAANYSVFLDYDGTTYSNATCLFSVVSLPANSSVLVEFPTGLPMNPRATGNLAWQAGTANALTITVNGIEF